MISPSKKFLGQSDLAVHVKHALWCVKVGNSPQICLPNHTGPFISFCCFDTRHIWPSSLTVPSPPVHIDQAILRAKNGDEADYDGSIATTHREYFMMQGRGDLKGLYSGSGMLRFPNASNND